MTFELTWLADVLLQAGLKVAEVNGWRDRGRASMGGVKGVVCHFTGGASRGNMPSLAVLIDGRTDLPGPLAQLGLGRDGTYYIVAAGKCNHAGPGSWKGITTGNTNFIGIEAENTGRGEPWPEVQMDAYRRGVAAILSHIGADESMCCGHKEWAPGRKDDPDFDMDQFRAGVRSLLAGTAPAPVLIPGTDTTGRPTLRRDSRGPLVRRVQALLDEPADGIFGPVTEAAVRRFQTSAQLVPDGIVGPKTWAAIDRVAGGSVTLSGEVSAAAARAGPGPIVAAAAGAGGPAAGADRNLDLILSIAQHSDIARYDWNSRGRAPIGYIKGMSVMFARLCVRLKKSDQIVSQIVQAPGNASSDALALYADQFRTLGMANAGGDVATLRHVFMLLLGLGMRESSGRFCEGRDRSATNTTAETAEAGLFQVSFNSISASNTMRIIFDNYRNNAPQLREIFAEGVRPKPADLENFGTGDGLAFQDLNKSSPGFAVEYAALGIRRIRKHWGPFNRLEAELRPEADDLFRAIEEVAV